MGGRGLSCGMEYDMEDVARLSGVDVITILNYNTCLWPLHMEVPAWESQGVGYERKCSYTESLWGGTGLW